MRYITIILVTAIPLGLGCVRNNPYDPEFRDNYQQLRHLTGVPNKRTECGFACTDKKLYVIGGKMWGSTVTDSIDVYDLQTSEWDTILPPPMPTKRYDCKTAVVEDKIYVFGGRDAGSLILTTVEEYDPAGNTWSVKASMPASVIDFDIAVVDNKVYLVGGRDRAVPPTAQSRVDLYDPALNTWTPCAPLTTARYNLGTAVMADRIYAACGQLNGTTEYTLVEVYDPTANQWSAGPSTNAVHTNFILTFTQGIGVSYLHIIDKNTLPDFEELADTSSAWAEREMVEPVSIAGLSQPVNHDGNVYFTDGSNVYWFLP